MPDFQGPAENFCKHCAPDGDGKVVAREAVLAGVTEWFLSWQPQIDRQTASQRADAYLKAMPHWAG
jgi:hypothetical protein